MENKGTMKEKASNLIKNFMSLVSFIAKAKLLGVKIKVDATRARSVVFSLLKRRRLSLHSISDKIHALLDKNGSGNETEDEDDDEESHTIVKIRSNDYTTPESQIFHDYELDDYLDKYPDLTHSMFGDEDEDNDPELLGVVGSSIIDLMKNSKEDQGQDFIFENEIDHVAEKFIKRFRKQMRLQKLESFKRYQAMLERGA